MVTAVAEKTFRAGGLLPFLLMLAIFCVLILSLPFFPTQDGPMHRYYVHVLSVLLSHQSHVYDVYRIRHPLPPYLTHYFMLFLLSKIFSWDLAEKVFACILVVAFACGFRFCAMALGPLGGVISLCIAPLLLQWAVIMGFMNYMLALCLFLFAAGFWIRAANGRGILPWFGFAVSIAVLAVTHPVPLLVLIGLCVVDLLLLFLRRPASDAGSSRPRYVWRVSALVYTCLAFLLISRSIDPSQSASMMTDMGFHLPFVKTTLLLTGVSPYNTRSLSFWVNSYRLVLYILLIGGFVLAFQRFRIAWRERALSLGDSLFVSAVLLFLVLPLTPERINGSFYFSTRLVVLIWVGFMLAACGYLPRRPRLEQALAGFAVAAAAISLITANTFLRPVAVALRSVELQPLPPAENGLIFFNKQFSDRVRFTMQLAPNPFMWAPVLPFVEHQDVALDSPWLDQAISPLAPSPGSPLLIDDISYIHDSKIDPPLAPSYVLPASNESGVVQATDFIVSAVVAPGSGTGLAGQVTPAEAARFHCNAYGWYSVCLSKTLQNNPAGAQ